MKKAGGLSTDQGEHDGFRGFGEGDFGANLNSGSKNNFDVRNKDIFQNA